MSLETRVREIKRKKLCLVCGFSRITKGCKDPSKHKCKKKFEVLECKGVFNGGACAFNGLTCNHKMVSVEVKEKIKEKLHLDLPGFSLVIIREGGLGQTPREKATPASIEELPHETFALKNDVKKEQLFDQRAAELQNGEVAKQMSNKELLEYFKQLEKRNGRDPSRILGVPEGEPLFIYCLIRGKTRNVRSFLDGGCSSWLGKKLFHRKNLPQ